MIAIIDYGFGNLRSVQKALEFLGADARITDRAADIADADHVVLPGVGAFRDAIARLRETGLDQAVLASARAGKPLLGICLGMQLMYEASEENGHYAGLGLLPGSITRLRGGEGLKIPHMGWNRLRTRDCPLFAAGEDPFVYFVHSYCAAAVDGNTAATCDYGQTFTAAACRDNVLATQFHPEKSGDAGLSMLKGFIRFQG